MLSTADRDSLAVRCSVELALGKDQRGNVDQCPSSLITPLLICILLLSIPACNKPGEEGERGV